MLERTRKAGAIRDIDVVVEARLLARLIDGLGLRAWLSGRWHEARGELVAHLANLGVAEPVLERMRAGLVKDEERERPPHADRGRYAGDRPGGLPGRHPDRGRPRGGDRPARCRATASTS